MVRKKKFTRKESATETASAGRPPRPNVPISSVSIGWDRWEEGTRFKGAHIPLGELGGAEDVGINLVELEPRKQSCPFHWHLLEEEHFFVLAGRCVLRTTEGRYEMRAMDYVCFPAGTRVAHCFENPFDQPCRLLAIGTRCQDEIAVYPDSGKMKLRALATILPWSEESLDYWEG